MQEWPERYRDLVLTWLGDQWDKPSRSDHYLMRIAQRVNQWSNSKATLKDQIIGFEKKKLVDPKTEMEARIARSKAVWIGGVEAAKKNLAERKLHGN